MHEWTAPRAHERTLTISVRPEFLLKHYLAAGGEIPRCLAAFVSEPRRTVDFYQQPLTSQMLEITVRLLDNPYTGALYLMYKEALALELLCVTTGSLGSRYDLSAMAYSERQLISFNAARQLLMKQLAPAPTLKQVAHSVGLAEKALTRGFKDVYGETAFEFALRSRMQYALQLLRDRHWSVDRVSETVGYSHPTSFATAFRRYFGLRPIDLKLLKGRPSRD
jgi:AraC-like DNA-binding protein